MLYANLQVQSYDRRTRRVLEVHATGLTRDTARTLCNVLRDSDASNEDAVGYQLSTMTLAAQIAHSEALGLVVAACDSAPYALAA